MKIAKASLLAASLLGFSQIAVAKEPSEPALTATPIGSPGAWLSPNDYPAAAMRYSMTGITAFTLSVDATGKPAHCNITQSSGFDILDTATCQRLMANARFSPAHDRAGKPVEGTFNSRVKWILPQGTSVPMSETFGSMLLSIDQTGKVTSCHMVLHFPAGAAASADKPCGPVGGMIPPPLGMEFRGNYKGASAEVEIQQADVFTPELRARVLAPMPGYEQRGLNIYRFTVTQDGKLSQCVYEEQRGNDRLATDYCSEARGKDFDPPFSAFNTDGVATGWHIARALLKVGG